MGLDQERVIKNSIKLNDRIILPAYWHRGDICRLMDGQTKGGG